jgi:hypothetical protein
MWRIPPFQGKWLWKARWKKWIKNCIEDVKIIFHVGGKLEFSGCFPRHFAGELEKAGGQGPPLTIYCVSTDRK